ncbi:MAG: hypothetical protein NXI12_15415 [Alphaproteobacteria bacterium]|nr:hypothetical protein [Alphaproteobacteria bacterium]
MSARTATLLVEDRDRLQGLLENTQEELAEARALDGEIGLVSSEVAYSHSQYSRTQKAKLALRFFEADLEWSGWWDYWDVLRDHGGPQDPPPRPDMRELVERWRADIAAGRL